MNFFLKAFLITIMVFSLAACQKEPINNDKEIETTKPNQKETIENNINVASPEENATITSPVSIKGTAKNWYFEGEFPIKIVDDKGNTLAEGFVTARDDWMTDKAVPFETTISFEANDVTKGEIIFEKANPTGLQQHDDSYSIPVNFE